MSDKKTKVEKKETKKTVVSGSFDKTAPKTKAPSKKARDIGIDVSNTPAESCSDSNCPYHGSLKVRGRVFQGKVKSAKMQNAAVVEWDYVAPVRKYQRFMRKKSRVVAHRPSCITLHQNDTVRIAECRPLSKTKSFVVIEKLQSTVKS